MSDDTAAVLAVDQEVLRSTGSAAFGLTDGGFVPKPFARLLAEKLALAKALFGEEIDVSAGSAIRKLLEVAALEDARTWSALAGMYDAQFVVSARGDSLSRLGEEMALPRPFLEARGALRLVLAADLPPGQTLSIPRGARLLTPGGHHVATDERVVLSAASSEREVPVVAFYPGPDHNLDPTFVDSNGTHTQRVDRFHPLDPSLGDLFAMASSLGKTAEEVVEVVHESFIGGGELSWPDARYRELLLGAPRSVWTVAAIRTALSLVPGVRRVQIRDGWGGLDITQPVFGNFNFLERVFGSERDFGSPYYFTVLIAPTPAAIWEGSDGLKNAAAFAMEDLRPIGVFPNIEQAQQVGVGVAADLIVKGVPLPAGPPSVVNASGAALALKARLLNRIRRYVDGLSFGEPVRVAEVIWSIMSEPGVVDVRNLALLRFPADFDQVDFSAPSQPGVQRLAPGKNLELLPSQIAVFVDDAAGLHVV